MKRTMKYIYASLCGLIILTCMALSFIMGRESRQTLKCERLEVRILDSLKNSFVSRADVKKFLDREYGIYKGLPLDSLDLVDVVVLVEQNFGITLTAPDFVGVKTFDDFYELLLSKVNG